MRHERPRSSEPLKVRRQKERRIFLIGVCVVAVLLFVLALYGIWRPEVRIQSVTASGPNAEAIQQTVLRTTWGTYWYVLPRNSIFFYPEADIRKAVQSEFPEVAAVSVSRSAFNALSVTAVPRISAFIWCGPSYDVASSDGACYDTDAEGLVFKFADSTSTASSSLKIFAPLAGDNLDSPLKNKVVGAQHIPNALRFVKAIRSLNVPVTAISIRDDEADIWVPGPTSITYVLGHEEEAAILAASAFPTLDFTDGTIQYVDLRFSKKVYVKRFGE